MKALNFFKVLFIVSVVVFLYSCSKDEAVSNRVGVKFKANRTTVKTNNAADVVISSFKINTTEIELEFNEKDPHFTSNPVATDIDLKGPFEIDLMKSGNLMETVIVNNIDLPEAAYDEIEFKFDDNKLATSEMFGKTMLIKGTINGKPFVYYTNEEFEVEIEFENQILLDDARNSLLTVSFNLSGLFTTSLGGVDLSAAVDGNKNGTIEIYPSDTDGNKALASLISQKIKSIIKAFEEKYDN